MNIVGSTVFGEANVEPKWGEDFDGLATGMIIDPCVVFPDGATITNVSNYGGFTVSVNAAQEAYRYPFKVMEVAVVALRFVATSSVTASVSRASDETTELLSFDAISAITPTIKDLGGRRMALGVISTNKLNCTAHFGTTRAISLSFAVTQSLTCKAPLTIIQMVPLSFIKTQALTPKAVLKITTTTFISVVLKSNPYGGYAFIYSTRFNWWVFANDDPIFPYRNPIYKTDLYRSRFHPVAVLSIT